MTRAKRFVEVTFLFLSICACSVSALAQETAPPGEGIARAFGLPDPPRAFLNLNRAIVYNRKELRIYRIDFVMLQWTPPKGRDIIYACTKSDNVDVVLILLDDGSIYETLYTPLLSYDNPPKLRTKADPTDQFQIYDKILGDALYVVSAVAVYVSRDLAATWKADTAGVGGGTYNDLALDTSQNAWLAHSTGLWKQHPDSNIWRKVTPYPRSFASAVFVDRRNRILSAAFQQVYLSTSSGSTWTIDTTGLGGQVINMFCDDAYGNLYAMSDTRIWKSAGGTQPWIRIDQPMSSLSNDPSVTPLFNSISGDSVLYAATVFGRYLSADKGLTWLRDSLQFPAGFIYGLVKTSSGKLLTSTNLGLFTKNSPTADWSKVFPSQGYLAGSPLFLDGSGTLYTLGARIGPTNPTSVRANWKSTDGGATWNPDTLGLGTIGAGQNQVYWVDETGIQHLAAYNTPAKNYSKGPGKAWSVDTIGYGNKAFDYPTAFGSDRHGNLYSAMLDLGTLKGSLRRRPMGGGAWVVDTAGLAGTQIFWITVDRTGSAVLGTTSGVYRKTGSTWGKVPSPPGLDGSNASAVSVDSTGALVAAFTAVSGFNFVYRGVYATRNNGTSWTYLGLDSLSVRGLVSYGDTTYAYTYADGFYKLRSPSASVSSVAGTTIAQTFELDQNYPNPFNPTTLIRFAVPLRSRYSLKIFDVLGREITQLVDGELEAGEHEVRFDATRYSSGVYFYQLQAGAAVLTRKLVVLK